MKKVKQQIKIVNCETGEEIVRDLTPDEILQNENTINELEAYKAEIQANKLAKSALLERLGITEDEAKLLLS